MNKEQFKELLNSMFSDDQGTLNGLNIRILEEDFETALVRFDWSQKHKQKSFKQTYDLSQAITAFNNGHKVYVLNFDVDTNVAWRNLSINKKDTLMMDITQIQDAEGHLFGWKEAQQ